MSELGSDGPYVRCEKCNARSPITDLKCALCGQSFVTRLVPSAIKHDAGKLVPSAIKHDAGKPRWDLLPFDFMDDVAAVLAYGAKKYADRNWEKGMAWGRLLRASIGHLASWARGIELDEESGLPHLAHAACSVLMLGALVKRKVGTDDRKVT
jgi:hypothetical protein